MSKKCDCNKRRIRNDVIFILIFLLAAFLGAIYLLLFREPGNEVEVTVGGEIYGIYSLNENVAVDIYSGEENSGVNRLIISDGKAFVESASCPDGICVAHRPINRDGESIVCLPNGVVIAVSVSDSSDSPDIVV